MQIKTSNSMLCVKLTTLPNFMLPRNAVHDLLDPMTVRQLLNHSERINHHIVINTGEACESVSTSSKQIKAGTLPIICQKLPLELKQARELPQNWPTASPVRRPSG